VDTGGQTLDFGKRLVINNVDHSNRPDWLWAFCGQLRVILTPYLPGKHCAVSPLQLLALVIHLEKLHAEGYFHGDIRGYNVVFQDENDVDIKHGHTYIYQEDNEGKDSTHKHHKDITDFVFLDETEAHTYSSQTGQEEKDTTQENLEDDDTTFDLQGCTACLIDLDFAGPRNEDNKYPQGYTQELTDADRVGRAGCTIAEHHEWRALRHILFHLHRLVPGDNPPHPLLDFFRDRFASRAAPGKGDILKLKKFLREIHELGWMVEVADRYRELLAL
jgi:hypothetical protein